MNWHERQAVKVQRKADRATRPARRIRAARKAAKAEAARQDRMLALNPFAGPVPVGLEIHPGPRLLGLARPGNEPPVVADTPAGRTVIEHMLGAGEKRLIVREVALGDERILVVNDPETGKQVIVRGRPRA